MNDQEIHEDFNLQSPQANLQESNEPVPIVADSNLVEQRIEQAETKILYWIGALLQPIIAVACIIGLVVVFGLAQRFGDLFTGADQDGIKTTDVANDTEYVCPMLCVLPAKEPGRCPVCGMQLKARKISGDSKDRYGMTLAPSARRLANIKTTVATKMPLKRTVQALGRIGYDEGSEAKIPAYVDGRLEKMIVDFTGAQVRKGDELAVLYSPELYANQIEMLEAKKAVDQDTSNLQRIIDANQRLYQNARNRLLEFGLTDSQIQEIEKTGNADSRVKITSPLTGTVMEKMAEEGDTVKTGQPIFKIANLSKVWLQLELFPEDAASVRIGQKATLRIESNPSNEFEGTVAFVDPTINSKTQTVAVRVVIPNDAGLIRIGEYAKASIEISPRALDDQMDNAMVVVPRNAVLVSGDHSVAYVESKPGYFKFREVQLGQHQDGLVQVISGIDPGEHVVTDGAFMLDAAFNMAGKPSLIDPSKAAPVDETGTSLSPKQLAEVEKALAELPDEDRALAVKQQICPVGDMPLGSMGKPLKVDVAGRSVFICCEGCREQLLDEPDKFFAKLDAKPVDDVSSEEAEEIESALAKLSAEDRALAKTQVFCPVANFRLGAMGVPIKVPVEDTSIFICCEGCRKDLLADPKKYIAILKNKNAGSNQEPTGGQPELPQMDLPKMDLPQMDLPKMDLPKDDGKSTEGALR